MLTTLALATSLLLPTTPTELISEWRYTSIRGTTYWDTSSGAYLGHGGGSSDTFVFAKDGTYKEYVTLVNSPSAGWTTKIFTTNEGRYEVHGNTLKLTLTKGHYKTEDNRVARFNIDRDMTAAELQKRNRSYRIAIAAQEGKPTLVFDLVKEKMNYESVR